MFVGPKANGLGINGSILIDKRIIEQIRLLVIIPNNVIGLSEQGRNVGRNFFAQATQGIAKHHHLRGGQLGSAN